MTEQDIYPEKICQEIVVFEKYKKISIFLIYSRLQTHMNIYWIASELLGFLMTFLELLLITLLSRSIPCRSIQRFSFQH